MRLRISTLAAAAALGLVVTGCGDDSGTCPTEAAAVEPGQDMAGNCFAPAAQQVAITLQLCEQCSRTAPSCDAEVLGGSQIFLNTSWELCEEDRSCSGEACSQVTCRLSLPNGTYTVSTLTPTGSAPFELTVSGAAASCSGQI